MKKENAQRYVLTFFIAVSVLLILLQITAGLRSNNKPEQHLYKEGIIAGPDTILIHPDSLWGESEFTNNR